MTPDQVERCEVWRQRITEQEATDLAVRDYCRERGLKESTFYAWRERLLSRNNGRYARGKTLAPSGRYPSAVRLFGAQETNQATGLMKLVRSIRFERSYAQAPEQIHWAFDKQSLRLSQNLHHPSFRAKKYDESRDLWQARVNRN
jgi:hypothetical protein